MWRAADKIVYSKTLNAVSSARTRIERDFDARAVSAMKAATGNDITVGGPDLAAQALREGLVDECQVFLTPIVIGGGRRSLPDNYQQKLELLDVRPFTSGVVYLRYRTNT
jgi:dihydrofolate reductase